MIAYCHTIINAPTAREATLTSEATSQVKIFVNGELVVDSVKEKLNLNWNVGSHSRRIKLQAGENLLLVKLGNAGNMNHEYYRLIRFNADITDSGDLSFAQEK